MFSWLFFGPMLSRYDHSSPYFSIVTYVIPTLLGRLRHLPFVQKMLDNAFIHEVCMSISVHLARSSAHFVLLWESWILSAIVSRCSLTHLISQHVQMAVISTSPSFWCPSAILSSGSLYWRRPRIVSLTAATGKCWQGILFRSERGRASLGSRSTSIRFLF